MNHGARLTSALGQPRVWFTSRFGEPRVCLTGCLGEARFGSPLPVWTLRGGTHVHFSMYFVRKMIIYIVPLKCSGKARVWFTRGLGEPRVRFTSGLGKPRVWFTKPLFRGNCWSRWVEAKGLRQGLAQRRGGRLRLGAMQRSFQYHSARPATSEEVRRI